MVTISKQGSSRAKHTCNTVYHKQPEKICFYLRMQIYFLGFSKMYTYLPGIISLGFTIIIIIN